MKNLIIHSSEYIIWNWTGWIWKKILPLCNTSCYIAIIEVPGFSLCNCYKNRYKEMIQTTVVRNQIIILKMIASIINWNIYRVNDLWMQLFFRMVHPDTLYIFSHILIGYPDYSWFWINIRKWVFYFHSFNVLKW